jgi:hypothetical protein
MSLYFIDAKKSLSETVDFDIEVTDPSLNGEEVHSLINEFGLPRKDFDRLFFSRYGIDYISDYFSSNQINFRVVTHPYETDTCFEKAELLGDWNPLNVIKALYFEYSKDQSLYAMVIPETGCFINRARVKEILNLEGEGYLRKATQLPKHMSFGTCSPFISKGDLKINGGRVEKIVFDSQTLGLKKGEGVLDDFSFGLDHRMSVQMNYYHCFQMLKEIYPGVIDQAEILNLSFKEKLVRNNGRISITFEFNSLDFRTTQFINSIHGYGEVSILNDYVDELDDRSLPRRRSSFVGTRARFRDTFR